MADSKISALPASTTPLAGTEVLPIVQSSTTRQVSVSNLTTGRSVSAASYVMSTGNLVPSTAAKGINFTANTPAAGMTGQLLDWYEEGTFTPTITFGGLSTGITYNASGTQATYTRIGRQITVTGLVTLTSVGTAVGGAAIAALPYSIYNDQAHRGVANVFIQTGITFVGTYAGIGINGTSEIDLYGVPVTGAATALTNTNFSSSAVIWFTFTYFTGR